MKSLMTGCNCRGLFGPMLQTPRLLAVYRACALGGRSSTLRVHGGSRQWPAYPEPGSGKNAEGHVRNRADVAAAFDGCDAVIHLAAAVGVGQSRKEIERDCSVNVLARPRSFWRRSSNGGAAVRKPIVASSMSVYGEGQYRMPDGRTSLPDPAARGTIPAGDWPRRRLGRTLTAQPTAEEKTPRPESAPRRQQLADQEEMCLSNWPGLRDSGRRHADVQRSRPGRQRFPTHTPRGGHFQRPLAQLKAAAGVRRPAGTCPPFCQRGPRCRAYSCGPWNATVPRAWRSMSAAGSRCPCWTSPRRPPGCWGWRSSPRSPARIATATSGTCFADIGRIQSTLDWRPQYSVPGGHSCPGGAWPCGSSRPRIMFRRR